MKQTTFPLPFTAAHSRRGFTFLEIMLVIMIIGLLAAVVGPRILGSADTARKKATALQIKGLESAVKNFALDVGRPPSTQQGLKALTERPSDVDSKIWDGPYIDGDGIPKDAWQQEYKYEFPTDKRGVDFAIWSLGKDATDGTDDDVKNWTEE